MLLSKYVLLFLYTNEEKVNKLSSSTRDNFIFKKFYMLMAVAMRFNFVCVHTGNFCTLLVIFSLVIVENVIQVVLLQIYNGFKPNSVKKLEETEFWFDFFGAGI